MQFAESTPFAAVCPLAKVPMYPAELLEAAANGKAVKAGGMNLPEIKQVLADAGLPVDGDGASVRQRLKENLAQICSRGLSSPSKLDTSDVLSEAPTPTRHSGGTVARAEKPLGQMSLAELKARAGVLGITDPDGHKGHKQTWIDAIKSGEGKSIATPPREQSSQAVVDLAQPAVAQCIGASQACIHTPYCAHTVSLPCFLPCRAVPCRAMPCRAVPCHAVSYVNRCVCACMPRRVGCIGARVCAPLRACARTRARPPQSTVANAPSDLDGFAEHAYIVMALCRYGLYSYGPM